MIRIILLAAVVIDLGIRSARSSADFPEVIHGLMDMLRIHAGFHPDVIRFLIIRIDRDIQTLRIESDPVFRGQKFPCPRNRFFLEEVSDREIAEHLEHRQMSGSTADILNVIRANAFLGIDDAVALRFLSSVKILLQGRNPCIDPEQRRIIVRDQAGTRLNLESLLGKEIQEHLTHLISRRYFSCFAHIFLLMK